MEKTRYEGIYVRALRDGRNVYYVRMRTGNGHRTFVSAGFRVADAKALQGRLRIEKAEGRWGIRRPTRASFDDLAEQYLARYRAKAKARNWPRVACTFRTFSRHFGRLALPEITPEAIEGFVQARRAKGINPRTVNTELVYLRAALNLAVEWGWIPQAPRIRPLPVERDSQARILTPAEVDAVLPQVSDDHAAAIQIALDTGLRLGELFRVRLEDIRQGDVLHVGETKSGRSRDIPLTPRAKALILRQLLQHKGRMFAEPSELAVSGRFAAERRRISGMPPWRFHDLRHNFATELLRGGADLYTAMQLTGHSNPKMLAIYLHSDIERKRDAIRSMRVQNGIKTAAE